MARKIAIIGKAPDTQKLAPFDDPTWEIWILNTTGVNKETPRWDRHFELHDLELTKDPAYGKYYEWMREQEKQIVLRDNPPEDFRNAVRYPLGDVLRTFDGYAGRQYLTNTVSLLAALAIHEHQWHLPDNPVECIGFWGVNMAQHGVSNAASHAGIFTSEYARQRPSVEYWIGVAEGKGIKVIVPEASDILKTAAIYGYHTSDASKKLVVRRQELQQRIANAQAQEQRFHDESIFLQGAVEGLNYDFQWVPTGGN